MIVIKNEQISPFDIDGTLVCHAFEGEIPPGESVRVYDAVSKGYVLVQINRPMVRLLREAKSRGDFVIAWSRGGHRWAADVIKALDLVECVDLVLSKPMAYFDDTEIQNWLPYRVMIQPGTAYKTLTHNKKGV